MPKNLPTLRRSNAPTLPTSISFHVTNLTARDANFLSTVIALFADPDNAEQAALLRDGKQVIRYSPMLGRAVLVGPTLGVPGAAQIKVTLPNPVPQPSDARSNFKH